MIENLNNIALNYITEGVGEPLILLHGNGEDHHIFDKLICKLKLNFCIYAIDSRNHGESSKTNDYSYETMVDDILLFIEKKALKNVSIIGFSDGAIIALLLAIRNKNIFDKMVLLGVNLKPTDFKDHIYTSMLEEYQKTKAPLLKLMLEEPCIELESLRNVIVPTLVVVAEDDIFKEESFTDIVEAMPNAVLKIMKGHDHGSYIISQDILYPDLTTFLLHR